MKQHGATYFILILAFITICSSWFSIRPSSEYRYQKLVQRSLGNPDSVSSEEWISHEIDEGMTALALIVVGSIVTITISICALLVMLSLNTKKFRTVGYVISGTWIIVAIFLHFFLWKIL